MELQYSVSLKPYNTLSLDVKAAYLCRINHLDDLHAARQFCEHKQCPWLLLGGGSNLVLTEDFDRLSDGDGYGSEYFGHLKHCFKRQSKVLCNVQAGYEWDLLVARVIHKRC